MNIWSKLKNKTRSHRVKWDQQRTVMNKSQPMNIAQPSSSNSLKQVGWEGELISACKRHRVFYCRWKLLKFGTISVVEFPPQYITLSYVRTLSMFLFVRSSYKCHLTFSEQKSWQICDIQAWTIIFLFMGEIPWEKVMRTDSGSLLTGSTGFTRWPALPPLAHQSLQLCLCWHFVIGGVVMVRYGMIQ